MTGDQKFALVAYEVGGAVRTAVISEGTALPPENTAIVRVFNAATDAGSIDVYVTDAGVRHHDPVVADLQLHLLDLGAGEQLRVVRRPPSSWAPAHRAVYQIRVTGAGNPSDLRLDIPQVILLSQRVATVILTPTAGGTLANGSVLVEDGLYSATPNTNARVRLLAAVTNGASVSATAVSASASASFGIGTNVVAPAIATYVNVPSDSALNVTVNGAPVAAPAGTLAAGSDTTLMVHGNAGSATAKLITDDNHLPAASNSYKLRLINGLTGAAVPLSMDVNFLPVASNVQPGAASAYTGLTTSLAAAQISVTSPSSPTAIFSARHAALPGSAVFTLFMLGDASAPIGTLRRDR